MIFLDIPSLPKDSFGDILSITMGVNKSSKFCPGMLSQYQISLIAHSEEQPEDSASMRYMETEIKELAERTVRKLKKLTGEKFAGLVFLPAEDME